MKLLAMFSTLIVTLTTMGWFGESEQCALLRDKAEQLVSLQQLIDDEAYNLASCEALAGNNDLAFHYLNVLKDKGFNDAYWLLADADFESLHQDGRWQLLVDEVSSVQQQMLAEIYSQHINN